MTLISWNSDKLLAAARAAGKKTLTSIAGDIVRDAKRYAPVGVAGQGRRGIVHTAPKESGGTIHTEIGFTHEAQYMQWIEQGRAAGKRPPPGALNLWVERKLGAGRIAGHGAGASGTRRGRGSRRMKGSAREQEIKTAAFLIGRAIGKHGIKARRFLRRAADTHAGQVPALFAHKFAEECAKTIPHK